LRLLIPELLKSSLDLFLVDGLRKELLDPGPHRLDQDFVLDELRCQKDFPGGPGTDDLLDLPDVLLGTIPELKNEQIGRSRPPSVCREPPPTNIRVNSCRIRSSFMSSRTFNIVSSIDVLVS
jgi:hypothetical protein